MTSTATQPHSSRLIRIAILFVGAGAVLYFAAMLWTGWEQAVSAIATIGFPFLVGGAVVSSTAYLWRFGRWEYCLRLLGYRIPLGFNLRVYISGLALTTSPGKVGETFRSVLLMPRGVRIPHSLGAFLADRLSDVLGVCLLGVVAGVVANDALPSLLTGAFISALAMSWFCSYAVSHPSGGRIWHWLTVRLRWLPVSGGQATLASWADLWSPRRSMLFGLIALLAYGTQALVFATLCTRVGLELAPAEATLIFVNATLFGAASMVPGGLGAMEAALVFQLVGSGVSEPTAVSLAIASRLVTLWTGVGLGVLAFASLSSQRNLLSSASLERGV